MRRNAFFASALLILFFTGLFTRVLLLSGYVFLNDMFTTGLCENVDKPSLKCNGSCAVMKMLNAADSQSSKSNQTKIADCESIKFFEPEFDLRCCETFLLSNRVHLYNYTFPFSLVHPWGIDRPPAS